ncbi:tRNA lysidine(34) synthetase TilS, partial [Rhizobium ruizarguesonis]
QPFAPGRAHMAHILASATGSEPGRMTVGRVVFDLRRDGLYLGRESRGILPLVLQPGEAGVWDGRFYARNGSAASIEIQAPKDSGAQDTSRFIESITAQTRGGWIPVTSTGMRECMQRLPKGAWKRAVASAPVLSAEGNLLSEESARMVELTPYFAPFDRFLTRFDFIFANRLSAVFATAPYARLPLRSIDGKTI